MSEPRTEYEEVRGDLHLAVSRCPSTANVEALVVHLVNGRLSGQEPGWLYESTV